MKITMSKERKKWARKLAVIAVILIAIGLLYHYWFGDSEKKLEETRITDSKKVVQNSSYTPEASSETDQSKPYEFIRTPQSGIVPSVGEVTQFPIQAGKITDAIEITPGASYLIRVVQPTKLITGSIEGKWIGDDLPLGVWVPKIGGELAGNIWFLGKDGSQRSFAEIKRSS